MKAVRSKCCKIFKKLTSILKNTSIADPHRRRQPRSSFAIDDYRQIIVDTKCLRETTRWIFVALIGSEVHSIVIYFRKTQTIAIVTAVVTKIVYIK